MLLIYSPSMPKPKHGQTLSKGVLLSPDLPCPRALLPLRKPATLRKPALALRKPATLRKPALALRNQATLRRPAAALRNQATLRRPAAALLKQATLRKPATALRNQATLRKPATALSKQATTTPQNKQQTPFLAPAPFFRSNPAALQTHCLSGTCRVLTSLSILPQSHRTATPSHTAATSTIRNRTVRIRAQSSAPTKLPWIAPSSRKFSSASQPAQL